jgi:hypothetical protein
MSEYNPDKWAIVKFKGKDSTWYKVIGSWYGGYLHGDSWRLSSGLERIEEDGDFYLMHNFSGSVYRCHKEVEGMHMTARGIILSAEKEGAENGVEVSVIDVEQFKKEQAESGI